LFVRNFYIIESVYTTTRAMKRQRSSSSSGRSAKKPRVTRQDATVTAVVRKELRKKTDWKYTDWSVTQNAVYNISQPVSLLSNLTRGQNGRDNFLGNVVRPQAITLKYFAESGQEAYEALRVIVFQWFDSSTPTTSGVLQTDATTTALVSPTLVTNKQYVKVLYDQLHLLALTSNPGGNGVTQGVTVYIPGKRLRSVRYNSNNNTCQDGNIFVCAISNDTALGTVNLTMYSRITFSDE